MAEKKFTKGDIKKLRKKLELEKKPVWPRLKAADRNRVLDWCDAYMHFISQAKTERQAVEEIAARAEKQGFLNASHAGPEARGIFWTFRDKLAALAVRGVSGPEHGIRLVASHIDAPRLDLKIHPLYEELGMVYFKTHYYGGIKKYQWVTTPLAMHGVILTSSGERITVSIGEDPEDPVFMINDLLPHLARNVQGTKKVGEAVPAEKLNILAGGFPILGPDDTKEAVKLNALRLLNEKYGIVEADFISAELEMVPAGPARHVGLDRAFICGYGHDDRSCAYAALDALFETSRPPVTCVALFLDKEEIGSDGNTGAKSKFVEKIYHDLFRLAGIDVKPDTLLNALMATEAISADVTAAVDPDYQEVHDKRNNAMAGHGICLKKYTGHGGKYAANDASAEYVNRIRRAWDAAGVCWQAGSMGKVDEGGGGTVAKYLAALGMNIVDAGPPLLSMHAPYEIAHKADLYMTFQAYRAFFGME